MRSTEREIISVSLGGGLQLHAEVVRNGTSTLVIPAASWLAADMDALTVGRTVVFYDIRGRGRSTAIHDMAHLGLELDVQDLERLRVALDIERFSILGWSYHAAIAAHYALAHPASVDRLVLVGSVGPRMCPYFGDYVDSFARRCDPEKLQRLTVLRREGYHTSDPLRWCRAVHELFLLAYLADGRHLARMKSSPCVAPNLDAERVNEQGRLVLEKLGDYDWRTKLAELETPTLLVHGRRDPVPFAGSEEWLASLPEAALVALADVGHLPWLEAPDRFFPPIETFLGGTWPATADETRGST